MSRLYLNAAMVFSTIPGAIGIYAMVRPMAALESIGFPVPATPEGKALSAAQLRMHMLRNLCITYLMATIWSTGDEKLMGVASSSMLILILGDGIVSRSLIGGGEWNHWSYAPPLVGILAGLFGYI